MAAPTVSIIITNFNYEKFLQRSVSSALAQEYGEVQVVIVDDKSTDGSRDVIRSFGARVTAVLKDVNGGHGAAMNSGFAASEGELVLLLDADDYLYPGAVASIVAGLRSDAALYQYRLNLVDGADRKLEVFPPVETVMDQGDVRAQLASRGRFSTTVTSGLAFPRRVLEKVLPMPEEAFRQGGDGYLVTVAPLHGSVVTVPGVLGAYCQHGANHSQFGLAVAQRARWRLSHDEMRFRELRRQAALVGLTVADEPGLRDFVHLGERIASLRLDPAQHPYRGDTPARIGCLGIASLRDAPLTQQRRRLMTVWWWVVGFAPRRIAGAAVVWMMSAGSRPALIDQLAKLVRRVTGRGRPIDLGPAET